MADFIVEYRFVGGESDPQAVVRELVSATDQQAAAHLALENLRNQMFLAQSPEGEPIVVNSANVTSARVLPSDRAGGAASS
jgi:hypothetical protein